MGANVIPTVDGVVAVTKRQKIIEVVVTELVQSVGGNEVSVDGSYYSKLKYIICVFTFNMDQIMVSLISL